MFLPNGQILGYCTNVHPYRTHAELLAVLAREPAALRRRLVAEGWLSADAPLGVGLWLPVQVAGQVARDPGPLRVALAEHGLMAYTANAFPWGDFHGERVKDAVFRPSWSQPERLRYTLEAAEALALVLPEGADGSISTHSGAHKAWPAGERDPDAIAAGLVSAARGLARLRERTGRRIVLAIEPEPCSLLETTDEVVAAFRDRLFAAGPEAREHLGVCFDACHQAVEFESMAASVAALFAAGIALGKVQLSVAIATRPTPAARARLAAYAEDRWFHQVVARGADGRLARHLDLPEALRDEAATRAEEWRIHFHVPIHAAQLDAEAGLGTTRDELARLLAVVAPGAVARLPTAHLEIETYSFEQVPAETRRALGAGTLVDGLFREFAWVLESLGVPRSG